MYCADPVLMQIWHGESTLGVHLQHSRALCHFFEAAAPRAVASDRSTAVDSVYCRVHTVAITVWFCVFRCRNLPVRRGEKHSHCKSIVNAEQCVRIKDSNGYNDKSMTIHQQKWLNAEDKLLYFENTLKMAPCCEVAGKSGRLLFFGGNYFPQVLGIFN